MREPNSLKCSSEREYFPAITDDDWRTVHDCYVHLNRVDGLFPVTDKGTGARTTVSQAIVVVFVLLGPNCVPKVKP